MGHRLRRQKNHFLALLAFDHISSCYVLPLPLVKNSYQELDKQQRYLNRNLQLPTILDTDGLALPSWS